MKLNPKIDFPPVVQILSNVDILSIENAYDLASKFKSEGLFHELKRQAEWSIKEFIYADKKASFKHGNFSFTPSGSLDPFSPLGKCSREACLIESTDDFINTIGLYTDIAYLTDPFTGVFFRESADSDVHFDDLFNKLIILKKLLPMINAGILQFRTPVMKYCKDCHEKEILLIKNVAKDLSKYAKDEYTFEILDIGGSQKLIIECPMLYPDKGHKLCSIHDIDNKIAKLFKSNSQAMRTKANKYVQDLFSKKIAGEVSSVLHTMGSSLKTNSMVVSGSRVEVLYLKEIEKQAPKASTQIQNWEAMRTVHLPWVDKLSAEEVLILREEADKALPRLRELLSTKLNQPTDDSDKAAKDIVHELRSQAFEVEAELSGLDLNKERRYQAGLGSLAMSFVIYGFASGVPAVTATSIAGLLAALAHLRTSERDLLAKKEKAVTLPAFALLKAREILQRRK